MAVIFNPKILTETAIPFSSQEKQQLDFFESGKTKDWEFRVVQLKKLKKSIVHHMEEIYSALEMDLGKSRRESYITEISSIISEIDYFIRNLKKIALPRRVPTPIFLLPARSFVYPEPLGRVLIISPWNFPFLLTVIPLVGAIAGGNCVVVKPSEISAHASAVLTKIVRECFSDEYVSIVCGDATVSQDLLSRHWGHVFFTGSNLVGKIVARFCAENLNPMTLELGGKSPVVVTNRANLRMAARRIIYGKGLNAGQTCVAPDYVLAHEEIRDRLVEEMKRQIAEQFGPDASQNSEFGRIISLHHFDRLLELQRGCQIISGGNHNRDKRYFELTLVDQPHPQAKILEEEIFGPILPILSYKTQNEMVRYILDRPKPLAAYIFTEDRNEVAEFMSRVSFGGGCVNDTVVHPSNTNLKFGGIGASGMGSYNAYQSFRTFTHSKSIVKTSTRVDLPIRYLPFSRWKEKILKLVK